MLLPLRHFHASKRPFPFQATQLGAGQMLQAAHIIVHEGKFMQRLAEEAIRHTCQLMPTPRLTAICPCWLGTDTSPPSKACKAPANQLNDEASLQLCLKS